MILVSFSLETRCYDVSSVAKYLAALQIESFIAKKMNDYFFVEKVEEDEGEI